MVRVLLVDDHALVRTGIRHLLGRTADIEVVGEAESGEEAIALAREVRPDVVLMDVTMPGMGGLEATRKLLRNDSAVRIVVLSMHCDGPVPNQMLEAGAIAYLSKDCSADEMVGAIRMAAGGQRFVSAAVAQRIVLNQIEGRCAPIEQLSRREFEILLMVCQGGSIGDISRRLCLSPKTISTYRSRLFKKLGAQSDVELTHLALRYGLVEPSGA